MRTKLIDSSIENSPGYGAGPGDVERYDYKKQMEMLRSCYLSRSSSDEK